MTDTAALGQEIRGLIRGAGTATLGTLYTGPDGPVPYCSLVLAACDQDGSPVLLLSTLARHTDNLLKAPAVSLLYDGTAGLPDPLTGARATVMGTIEATDDPRLRARYLARHPSAEDYADFGDFSFYRVHIRSAHLVAGFGRIHDVEGGDIVLPESGCREIAEAEADIVDHMNDHHGDAMDAYARGLGGLDGGGWRMTGCDPDGADLHRQGAYFRLPFPEIARTTGDVRTILVELAQTARKMAE